MKNWRTFALGMAGAVFTAILPVIKTGTFDIQKDWVNLVEAAGIAFFGYVAKDALVTGKPKDKPEQDGGQ